MSLQNPSDRASPTFPLYSMQSNFARKRSQSSLALSQSPSLKGKNSWRDSIVGHRYFCKNTWVYGRYSLHTNYIYSSLIRRLSCSVFALSTDDSGNPRIHGCDMLGLLAADGKQLPPVRSKHLVCDRGLSSGLQHPWLETLLTCQIQKAWLAQ